MKKGTKLAYNKLVAFDEATFEQILAAAASLGIPETAFIRLSVHRALGQILQIYMEMIDGLAREYAARRANEFCSKAPSVPLGSTEWRQYISGIGPTEKEAGREVDLANRKRTPRSFGELNFPGPLWVAETPSRGRSH